MVPVRLGLLLRLPEERLPSLLDLMIHLEHVCSVRNDDRLIELQDLSDRSLNAWRHSRPALMPDPNAWLSSDLLS